MKRCVDSGLWVPNAADAPQEDDEAKAKADNSADTAKPKATEDAKEKDKSKSGKEEPIYSGVSTDDLD